jgi:chemotaxis protein CheX
MSVTADPALLREDLVRIVQDIFTTMLAMEVQVLEAAQPNGANGVLTAAIHLSGGWTGAVLLECGLPTACELAAAMIGIEKPAAASDQVKDVMGELINMVAGNFKATLGCGAHLSEPAVAEGSDYRARILRGKPAACVALETPAGAIVITIVEASR